MVPRGQGGPLGSRLQSPAALVLPPGEEACWLGLLAGTGPAPASFLLRVPGTRRRWGTGTQAGGGLTCCLANVCKAVLVGLVRYRGRYSLNTECNRPSLYVLLLLWLQFRAPEQSSQVRFGAGSSGHTASLASSKMAISHIVLGGCQNFSSRTVELYVPNLNVLLLGCLSSVTFPEPPQGNPWVLPAGDAPPGKGRDATSVF